MQNVSEKTAATFHAYTNNRQMVDIPTCGICLTVADNQMGNMSDLNVSITPVHITMMMDISQLCFENDDFKILLI